MHPERRVTLDSIRFGDVLSHPLSKKVYGEPKPTKEMLSSIVKVGMLQPLIVNETIEGKFELIVGNTRREAWEQLYTQGKVKSQWVPCKMVKLNPLEAEQLVLESNRQRVKTKVQEAKEYKESLRVEKELAEQKKVPFKKETSQAAAGLSKMGRVVADRLVRVLDKAEAGDARAVAALQDIEGGKGVTPAWRTTTKRRNVAETAEQDALAKSYTKQFADKSMNVVVTRAKNGEFHVMLKNQTAEQIEQLLKKIGQGDGLGETLRACGTF